MTVVAGSIVASCSASEITGPAVNPREQRPLREATTFSQVITIPIPTPLIDPCNAQTLDVDANLVITTHTTTSSISNFHFYEEMQTQGKATGIPSGNPYIVDSRSLEEYEAAAPFPFETTTEKQDVYVSKGPLPNFVMHLTIHKTVNALGVMTPAITNAQIKCTGETS
jgi:hypothetical protein